MHHRQSTLMVCALFLASNAFASDFQSARTAALGGAGRGGPILNDSIYLNPSFVAFLPTYSISGSYASFKDSTEQFYGRNYNVSIQDGRSQLFQAGVGYALREDRTLIHLGAGKRLAERWGVGVGGKYVTHRSTADVAIDLNSSVSYLHENWLQLALVSENLLQSNKSKAAGLHREIALGTKINIQHAFILYLDPHFTPGLSKDQGGKFGYELGGEASVMSDLFFRMGYFKDSKIPHHNLQGEGFALGGGWVGPRFSLDYAFKRVIKVPATSLPDTTSHSAGMTLYF